MAAPSVAVTDVQSTSLPAAGTDASGLDDPIELGAGPNQTVSGTLDAAAGTDVTVRLRGHDPPFLLSAEIEVDDDGRFEATFDLTDVEPGAEARIEVRRDGDVLAESTVVVEEPDESTDGDGGDTEVSDDPDSDSEDDTGALSDELPGFGAIGTLLALWLLSGVGLSVARR